jgi:hypothetical protein
MEVDSKDHSTAISNDSSNLDIRCFDILCSNIRPLRAPDLVRLDKIIKTFKIKWISFLIAPLLPFPLLIYSLFFISELFKQIYPGLEITNFLAAILSFVLIFIGTPVCWLRSRDHFVMASQLKNDLLSKSVYCFDGVRADLICFTTKDRYQLNPSGKIGDTLTTIDVLPYSSMILSANGSYLNGISKVKIIKAVSAPKTPYVISLPNDLYRLNGVKEGDLNRRRLSQDEINEAKTIIQNLKKRTRGFYGTAAYLGLGILSGTLYGFSGYWFHNYGIVFGIALFLFLNELFKYFKSILISSKMIQDISLGWVVITQKNDGKLGVQSGSKEKIEFLPVSTILWTKGGQPSNWRYTKLNS